MAAPEFWADADRARAVSKQAADLRTELATWEGFLKEVEDLKALAEFYQSEGDETLHDEIAGKLKILSERFSKLEFATLFSGEYDQAPAIVSIHAGSGGTEAQDWTEMLTRMVMRFAE